MAWLLQQDMEEWDKQIEEDFSPGGRGMALLEEAEADIQAGRVKPWMSSWPRPKPDAMRKSLGRFDEGTFNAILQRRTWKLTKRYRSFTRAHIQLSGGGKKC